MNTDGTGGGSTRQPTREIRDGGREVYLTLRQGDLSAASDRDRHRGLPQLRDGKRHVKLDGRFPWLGGGRLAVSTGRGGRDDYIGNVALGDRQPESHATTVVRLSRVGGGPFRGSCRLAGWLCCGAGHAGRGSSWGTLTAR